MDYIAHINGDGSEQTLYSHLINTASLARQFASSFDDENDAYQCGMMHDIGKYEKEFQKRIRGSSIKVDHSTAGAIEAFEKKNIAVSFCIAGHHAGLPNRGFRSDTPECSSLLARVKRKIGVEIYDYSDYKNEIDNPIIESKKQRTRENAFFYTHMIYSCLVDADWLDTEAFMKSGSVERGTGESFEVLYNKLDTYISKWWNAIEEINVRRCEILRNLIEKGNYKKGIYTLTVPTGGGKTVSSMAFALKHVLHNKQKRIIYVIPYTSIIEQTQTVFERIFGSCNVVAHFANIAYETNELGEMSKTDQKRYLASENWDAPIILTTAVQFFESLFGNRPSECRKMHNIAESTIIFDEAQMLPVNYLEPCIWAMAELVNNYGCTAVLCTATQPALEKIISKFIPSGSIELCKNIQDNYVFFKRVNYRYEGLLSDESLVEQVKDQHQVLCIVNSRKQAQNIFLSLPENTRFHLSTAMVPIHRREVLSVIRNKLMTDEPCMVISTSLIEAGVDIDFPCVYRAIAGLDSIIQAAGRCNREGKRPVDQSTIHIFDTDTKSPSGMNQNIAAARHVISQHEDISSPKAIEDYFNFLLYTLKDKAALDNKEILRLIREDMAFKTVSEQFQLIENSTITVYIPYGKGKELINELLKNGPNKRLMRELGQYSVSVYPVNYASLDAVGAMQKITENTAVLINPVYYDINRGLSLSPEGGEALFG